MAHRPSSPHPGSGRAGTRFSTPNARSHSQLPTLLLAALHALAPLSPRIALVRAHQQPASAGTGAAAGAGSRPTGRRVSHRASCCTAQLAAVALVATASSPSPRLNSAPLHSHPAACGGSGSSLPQGAHAAAPCCCRSSPPPSYQLLQSWLRNTSGTPLAFLAPLVEAAAPQQLQPAAGAPQRCPEDGGALVRQPGPRGTLLLGQNAVPGAMAWPGRQPAHNKVAASNSRTARRSRC